MKKKILYLILLVIVTGSPICAQFRDNVNLSLFAGGYAAQKNGNNNGYWYGMYGEFMPIKTSNGLNLGFCVLASRVQFKSNDLRNTYQGSSNDFGAGLSFGKYTEFFTQKYSSYVGMNAMIKSSKDDGLGRTLLQNNTIGEYSMTQKDLMFSTELNINLLKTFGIRENLFPRSQLKFGYQKPLKTEKTSFWNKTFIQESMIWNKAAFSTEFKQSLVQIGRLNTLVEPKAMLGFNYYKGDDSKWLYYGPEIAFKNRGWDDFLTFYCLVKQQVGSFRRNVNERQFVFGMNFIPSNIKKK